METKESEGNDEEMTEKRLATGKPSQDDAARGVATSDSQRKRARVGNDLYHGNSTTRAQGNERSYLEGNTVFPSSSLGVGVGGLGHPTPSFRLGDLAHRRNILGLSTETSELEEYNQMERGLSRLDSTSRAVAPSDTTTQMGPPNAESPHFGVAASPSRLALLRQMVNDEEREILLFQQQEMIVRERLTLQALQRESMRRRHADRTTHLYPADYSVPHGARREQQDQPITKIDRRHHLGGMMAAGSWGNNQAPQPFSADDTRLDTIWPRQHFRPSEERLYDMISRSNSTPSRQMIPPQPHSSKKDSGSAVTRSTTKILALPSDKGVLSPYQRLIRESIQVFEAQTVDIDFFANSQGRNRKVELGQVGVRCRYCAHRPLHWCGRGAVYFPGSLSTIYQAAQNMAANHFLPGICEDMPDQVKNQFNEESQKKKEKSSKRSAGKEYWECACRSLGLEDSGDKPGVWFRREKP